LKIFHLAIWHFLALVFELDIEISRFCLNVNFGLSSALTWQWWMILL